MKFVSKKQAENFNKSAEGRVMSDVLAKIRGKKLSPPPNKPPPCRFAHLWNIRYRKEDDCFTEFCKICGESRPFEERKEEDD